MIASLSSPRDSLGAVLNRYGRDRLNLSDGAYHQIRVAVALLERFLGCPARLDELHEQLLIDWMRWLRTRPPTRSDRRSKRWPSAAVEATGSRRTKTAFGRSPRPGDENEIPWPEPVTA